MSRIVLLGGFGCCSCISSPPFSEEYYLYSVEKGGKEVLKKEHGYEGLLEVHGLDPYYLDGIVCHRKRG